jgi:hypothetical protein
VVFGLVDGDGFAEFVPSSERLGPKVGSGASGALVWPEGRRMGVPLPTIEDARP